MGRDPNPAVKRLQWVAERYSPDVLMLTADVLAEALGIHTTFLVNDEAAWQPAIAGPQRVETSILHRASTEFPQHTRYDRYLPWVAREMNRLRDDFIVGRRYSLGDTPVETLRWWRSSAAAQELRNRFRSIVDWAEAEKVDLNRYRADEAVEGADEWASLRDFGEVPQGLAVYTFDDGWSVQQLATQDQLNAESKIMQHCLENYEAKGGGDVSSSDGRDVWIYSLRDHKGHPHATLEWDLDDSYVSQLRGKQNDVPKPEYLERMIGFRLAYLDPIVAELGFETVDDPKGYDLFGKTPLLGTYSVRGAYGARRDARLLIYEELVPSQRGVKKADVFSPEKVDAANEELLGQFDSWWDGVDPPSGLTEDEFLAWEQQAQEDAWAETTSNADIGALVQADWAYRSLHWMVWRDHRALLDDNEDEMVQWLAGGRSSPTCRFLGQRAANVATLRKRLMP